MNEMQSAAVKVAALDTSDTAAVEKFVAEEQEKLRGMTQYTFSNAAGNGSYDLYIWTNGADRRAEADTGRYPYLRKVDYENNVSKPKTLTALFSKQFVVWAQRSAVLVRLLYSWTTLFRKSAG